MLHANQLQFNLDVPSDPHNMQTDFSSPSAIVYEKIVPRYTSEIPRGENAVKLSKVSSDRLSAAVQLAQRDLKLAKRRRALESFARENELDWEKNTTIVQSEEPVNANLGPKTKMCLVPVERTEIYAERKPAAAKRGHIKSSPQKLSKHQQEVLDIHRLRLELNQLVAKLEESIEDQRVLHSQKLLTLDHEEEQRLVVRHLEQMRKSSRTVYTLQQQTQLVKDDLKKKEKQNSIAVNKGKALSRLAAVHRGTVRLFQVYSKQLPEHLIFEDNFVAVSALYQEVSRLIKELALCSLQFDLTNVEDVERIADVLKNIEPKYTPPPKLIRSPKGQQARTPQRRLRTPQRTFKSKQFDVIKKSPVRPRLDRPSSAPTTPLIRHQSEAPSPERPVWRPSNSPYKNVGPPPLSPLLESPAPAISHRTKPKQVTFFSTPKQRMDVEHDIDDFREGSPQDIKELKSKLANELEEEVRNRIKPLLKKVENLSKLTEKPVTAAKNQSPEDEILERQVREIVDETKKEMLILQEKQAVEEEALDLYQGPSIESLSLRLDSICKEEEAIRRRWKEINYRDTRPASPALSQSECRVPKTPQPIKFTKSGCQLQCQEPEKRIVNFLPEENEEIRPRVSPLASSTGSKKDEVFSGRTLTLPQSTLNAVKRSKRDFERHLKFTFHEPKGRFDPWRLVEELSDQVLDEVLASVSKEVNGLCEDYVSEIFQREFANASLSSEPSMMSSDSSEMESPSRPPR